MLAWDAATDHNPVAGENLAPYAVAGAGQDWNWDSPPSNMIDNDAYSAFQSVDSPVFPQYLYLDWEDTQTFDTFIMKTAYSQGQAPTNWDLEVSADGETGWTHVASSGDIAWDGNDWHVEEYKLTFSPVQGKALRIKINNANLQWDHYAINEVLVKDSSVSPVNANIASETTSEWDSENGGLLTDGDLTEAAQSDNRPSLPMDIVLKWPMQAAFNEIQMHCWYAKDQAPTQVSFQISQDGQNWQEIVAPTTLFWSKNDATIETQTFSFDRVQNVKYLRMRIHDANLTWRHFAINELEVYDRQLSY